MLKYLSKGESLLLGMCLGGIIMFVAALIELCQPQPCVWDYPTPQTMSHSVFQIRSWWYFEEPTEPFEDGFNFRSGTAFLTNWQGKTCLITAWHVVDNGLPVMVFSKEENIEVTFTRFEGLDLAWAIPDKIPQTWVPLELTDNIQYGSYATCWGYPFNGKALQATYATLECRRHLTGHPAEMEVFYPQGNYMVLRAMILPGMSGGPVTDNLGRVYAINCAIGKERDGAATSTVLDIP